MDSNDRRETIFPEDWGAYSLAGSRPGVLLPTCYSSLPPLQPGNDRCAGCHRERGWLVRLTDCSSSVLTYSSGIQANFWWDIAELRDDRTLLANSRDENSIWTCWFAECIAWTRWYPESGTGESLLKRSLEYWKV